MAYDRVISFRPDTSTNWALYNTVLSLGEGGLETDTMKTKIGNGSDVWSDLPYLGEAGLLARVEALEAL